MCIYLAPPLQRSFTAYLPILVIVRLPGGRGAIWKYLGGNQLRSCNWSKGKDVRDKCVYLSCDISKIFWRQSPCSRHRVSLTLSGTVVPPTNPKNDHGALLLRRLPKVRGLTLGEMHLGKKNLCRQSEITFRHSIVVFTGSSHQLKKYGNEKRHYGVEIARLPSLMER